MLQLLKFSQKLMKNHLNWQKSQSILTKTHLLKTTSHWKLITGLKKSTFVLLKVSDFTVNTGKRSDFTLVALVLINRSSSTVKNTKIQVELNQKKLTSRKFWMIKLFRGHFLNPSLNTLLKIMWILQKTLKRLNLLLAFFWRNERSKKRLKLWEKLKSMKTL